MRDVNGVREIEQGDFAKGIARTKATLARTSVSVNRLPLLNNLCVAYVAVGDLDSAKAHCNEAVDARSNNGSETSYVIILNFLDAAGLSSNE